MAQAACVPARTSREKLILNHLPLVKSIATRVHENLPVNVEIDDLVHAGILGLLDAFEKFNATKNVPFSSYAKYRIRGAILDSLRELDWASRDLRRRQKRVEAAARELAGSLRREPTDDEMAAKLGLGMERWYSLFAGLQSLAVVSASGGAAGEEIPPPEYPAEPETRPDSLCARQELRTFLDRALDTLSPRYRMVMRLYYTQELTMRQIGEVLGVNESRVSQIHKCALGKLAAALAADGIYSSGAF